VRRVDEKEGEQRHQRDAAEYGTQRALHELTIHPPAALYAAAPDCTMQKWSQAIATRGNGFGLISRFSRRPHLRLVARWTPHLVSVASPDDERR
jgi:hypothetical protein